MIICWETQTKITNLTACFYYWMTIVTIDFSQWIMVINKWVTTIKMNIGNVNDAKYDIIKELVIIIGGLDDDKVGVNV